MKSSTTYIILSALVILCILSSVSAIMVPFTSVFRIHNQTKDATMSESPGDAMAQPILFVKTNKSNYPLSKPIKITLTVKNPSDKEMTLRFPSGKKYDFWAVKDDKEVWRWSHGMMFTQALTSLILAPGESKTFEQEWQQVSDDGLQIGPGAYDLYAQLTTFPPRPSPAKTQIMIGRLDSIVKPMTINTIISDVDKLLGQVVSISGTYKGWRPDPDSPACQPGPPVMRSDWAISDETGCIYVTGKSGLDPTEDYGKRITVVGIIKKTSSGQPYIESRNVT